MQGPRTARTRAVNEQVKSNNPLRAGPSEGLWRGRFEAVPRGPRAGAETARAATPEQAEAEKKAAREWVLEQLRAGREVGWRDVQRYFEKEVPEQRMRMVRGETWCRQRIKEAEREHKVLHLAATS